MKDYYLRTDSKGAMFAALAASGVLAETGDVLVDGAVDVIGIIHERTGRLVRIEGEEVPEYAPIPGYHANLRAVLTPEQEAQLPIIPAPAKPVRVWA